MAKLPFTEFERVYRESLSGIWAHWNEQMQAEIARHCVGWAPGRFDFKAYLDASSVRFYKAFQALESMGTAQKVCDIGGFWGIWPVTLRALGYDVTMTETLRFYSRSFQPLFDAISKSGVEIYDFDPFSSDVSVTPMRFDFVTVMAVLEHYPHSLKQFIYNVRSLTAPTGRIYLEVPNIAYFPNRVGLMFGRSPLVPVEDLYASEEPFIGHHHEFTPGELRSLARLGGLRIVGEELYNYSFAGRNKLAMLVRHPALSLATLFSKESRECIAVVCEVDREGSHNN